MVVFEKCIPNTQALEVATMVTAATLGAAIVACEAGFKLRGRWKQKVLEDGTSNLYDSIGDVPFFQNRIEWEKFL